jgi:probable phosphoglycerate mutase
MAHLLALPYPYVASVLPCDFASITTISFPVAEGEWVFPRVELFNDCGHIRRANGRG